jgi:DNA-binding response OmpR family regulator
MDTRSPSISPRHILIVDDEIDFTNLLQAELEKYYQVSVANSGEDAVNRVSNEKFDVILLDYKLPGISGLSVLERMNEQKIDTPVIFFTAYGTESVANAATKLGAYDFVRRENLDYQHLPLMINATYERYLFRKERERQESEEQELQARLAAIEMFRKTVESIAHYVNHALSVLSLDTEHYEKLLLDLANGGREQVSSAFEEMRQEIKIVEAGVKSMLNLSDLVYAKYSGEKNISSVQNELQEALKVLQSKEVN